MPATYKAYAKINLGLRIVGKRPDGFHNIETIFHRINLFDEIELSNADEIVISSSSVEVPGDASNICYKAAAMLQRLFAVSAGVRISIAKNIPVGAGLGGGSSDAATVLQALPDFWHHSLDPEKGGEIARELGSDVPFFLGGSSAVGTGRGEVLEYFPCSLPYAILVCYPNIHVSTAWAYQQQRPHRGSDGTSMKDILLRGITDAPALVEGLHNDFEPAVFARYPEILRVKERMIKQGAVFALMSGSGSSVYGLYTSEAGAAECSRELRSSGYRVFLTPPHFQAEPL